MNREVGIVAEGGEERGVAQAYLAADARTPKRRATGLAVARRRWACRSIRADRRFEGRESATTNRRAF
jgi:hypothetical protein